MKKESKNKLFLELCKPNKDNVSRWVDVSEFKGKYEKLSFSNGADWARRDGWLARNYIIEFDRTISPGNKIDKIRTNGLNNDKRKNNIRKDIKEQISKERLIVGKAIEVCFNSRFII